MKPSLKIDNLKDLFDKIYELAKASGTGVRNIFNSSANYLTGLSSRPWMVRHATEAVMNGVLVDVLAQPTLCYFGYAGISEFLNDRKELLELVRERYNKK